MKKILHVDDMQEWTDTVKNILTGNYELIAFNDLPDAKVFYSDCQDSIDLVICDGSIHQRGDGVMWARELLEAGAKVMILSGEIYPGVTCLDKSDVSMEKVIAMVENMLGIQEVS